MGERQDHKQVLRRRDRKLKGLLHGKDLQLVHDRPCINVNVPSGNHVNRGREAACSECNDKGVKEYNNRK